MGDGSGSQQTNALQQNQYRTLLNAADARFTGGGFFDKQFAGGRPTLANLTPEQKALQERMTGVGGISSGALSALERQLGPYDANNPALTAAIDAATGDVARGLKEGGLIDIDQGAVGAGQFGSSRQGVAEGLAIRGAGEQMSDIATQMRLQDLQAFQNTQQNALANLGNLTQGIEYAGGGEQREEQRQLDELFREWEYTSGVDLQNLMTYKGLVSGDMGGSAAASGK